MSDRKMIKWLPFNSVITGKSVLYDNLKAKAKIPKPKISEDEEKIIENTLIDAYYSQYTVKITYYLNGYLQDTITKIKKIDKFQKLIYLNNTIIYFHQIITMKPV